jgi:hypothetical protein
MTKSHIEGLRRDLGDPGFPLQQCLVAQLPSVHTSFGRTFGAASGTACSPLHRARVAVVRGRRPMAFAM